MSFERLNKARLMAGAARLPLVLERKDANDPATLIAEIKKVADEVGRNFEEYKKANDQRLEEIAKKGAPDPVTVEKLAKIETALAKHETLGQQLQALEASQKAAKAAAEELELKIGRMNLGDPEARRETRKKAVNQWGRAVISALVKGEVNLNADERKALETVAGEYKSMSVTNDTTGGYLAPSELVLEIIKAETELSPVRQLANVKQTTNKSRMQPKRTGQFAARRVTEQGARTETTGLTYGMEEIHAPEMYALIDISHQNLEDSAFDLEAEIRDEAVEQFAVKEGSEFVSGTGVGEMEGILTNGSVAETVSGAAATVTADGLITLKHDIKSAYARNASFVLNRTTLGAIRKLKDGNGQYLWMPGLASGKPNSIDGDPYIETPDMPNQGAGLYPVAYGDFKRAYTLVDRIVMQMLRDPFTQATSGNIRFLFYRRVGGKVVLAEAIRKLKCAAA